MMYAENRQLKIFAAGSCLSRDFRGSGGLVKSWRSGVS